MSEIQTQETFIENELKKYNVTDAAIAEMQAKYMPLKINGIEDREGYKVVRESRLIVKAKRIEVEKKRKDLKEDSLKFGRAVDAEAKRITLLLEPIEDHLEAEEKAIEAEKERIQQEEERKEQERIQGRIKVLFDMGMAFNGDNYSLGDLQINSLQIISLDDQFFNDFVAKVSVEHEKEVVRLAEIERQKKDEEERLSKVAAEQEQERLRLEKIAREQEEKELALKAEAERIEKEKAQAEQERLDRVFEGRAMQLIELGVLKGNGYLTYPNIFSKSNEDIAHLSEEDFQATLADISSKINAEKECIEKQRQAEIESAKQKAIEQEKERAQRESDAKAEAERLASEKAARKLARQPDRERLLAFAETMQGLPIPTMKHEDGKKVIAEVMIRLNSLVSFIETEANKL